MAAYMIKEIGGFNLAQIVIKAVYELIFSPGIY